MGWTSFPQPDKIEAPRLERIGAFGGLRQKGRPGDLVLDLLDELLDARCRRGRLLVRERDQRVAGLEIREIDPDCAAHHERARDQRDDQREVLAVDATTRGHPGVPAFP
jgi:hypothetical protein